MANINRISKYMYCFYSSETPQFKANYNSIVKESLYLGDDGYKKEEGFVYNNHIFALINLRKTANFDKALMYFRADPEVYEDDYEVSEHLHMLVFKMRDEFKKSLRHFKKSQFSKMYSKEYVDKYFNSSKNYSIKYNGKTLNEQTCAVLAKKATENDLNNLILSPYAVLTKSPTLRGMLDILYKIELDPDTELDNHIKLEEEVYRFSEDLRRFDNIETGASQK